MKTLTIALSKLRARPVASLGRLTKAAVCTVLIVILDSAVFAQFGFDYNSVQRDILMEISGNAEALKARHGRL